MDEENKLVEERREKLQALREKGQAFPNDWRSTHYAGELAARYGMLDKPALEAKAVNVRVAGRMMLKRVMGKASFATRQDASGRIPAYVANDSPAKPRTMRFKNWDLGDIVGVEGTLFKTNKGELTVNPSRCGCWSRRCGRCPEEIPRPHRPGVRYRRATWTDRQSRARAGSPRARSRAVPARDARCRRLP